MIYTEQSKDVVSQVMAGKEVNEKQMENVEGMVS